MHNCISWLLGFWFLTNAKNITYYGIPARLVLSYVTDKMIEEQGGVEVINKQHNHRQIMLEIENIVHQLDKETSEFKRDQLALRIKTLYNEIDASERSNFNLDTLLEEIEMNKPKNYDMTQLYKLSDYNIF